MPPSLDAATYARTSTEQQKSCTAQQALCRELIDKRGWHQAFRLQDEGHKGGSADRPAYQRLMELVEERRIQVVVTWKLDRMFRSLKEASTAQETFRECDVALVSYTEPFDTTTSIGRFVFGFLANVAAFETELIKERALLGYQRRAQEGRWTGPHVPFGYRRDADGKLVVEAEEAATLRYMHSHYARAGGDHQLAVHLNAASMLRRGQPWDTERVRAALTHPLSIGNLTLRGATQHHPSLAILAKKRFTKTAKVRASLRHLGSHRPSRHEEGLDRVFNDVLATWRQEDATAN